MTVANKTAMSNVVEAKLINMTHPGQFKLDLVDKQGNILNISIPIPDVISKEQAASIFKANAQVSKTKTAGAKVYRINGRLIREALTMALNK
jgi:hypothetical protein